MNFHYRNYKSDRIHRFHQLERSEVEHQNRIQWSYSYNLQLPKETKDENKLHGIAYSIERERTNSTSGSFTFTDCLSWPKNFSFSCSVKLPKTKSYSNRQMSIGLFSLTELTAIVNNEKKRVSNQMLILGLLWSR